MRFLQQPKVGIGCKLQVKSNAMSRELIKKKGDSHIDANHLYFVDLLGFEPRQTEPKSGVLPLHHRSVPTFMLAAVLFHI